jgi:hypothetical protein
MPMENFYLLVSQLQIGDRIVVPKSLFNLVQHHAIYIGVENGVHYFIENKDFIGVRVVSAEVFFNGAPSVTRIEKFMPSAGYGRYDLKRFALSKVNLGYHLTNYNCEHFANEIQHGHKRSVQVDNFTGFAKLAASLFFIAGILKSFD